MPRKVFKHKEAQGLGVFVNRDKGNLASFSSLPKPARYLPEVGGFEAGAGRKASGRTRTGVRGLPAEGEETEERTECLALQEKPQLSM